MKNYIFNLLNKKDLNSLKNYYLLKELYLDINVYIVDKYSCKIYKYGKICDINDNRISILVKNKYTLHIDKNDYYFFSKLSQKYLYQYLLTKL